MAVHSYFDLKDKIKKYFRFSKEELKGIFIAILVLAFIISFKDWGSGDDISVIAGLFNLIVAIIIVAITVFIHIAAQKIYALHVGFKADFKMWWYGLLIGLIIIFISRGKIWFLVAGGVFIHHMTAHRLGHFRYGTNVKEFGLVALAGPVANLLFATFSKSLQVNFHVFSPENVLINRIFLLNFAYAAYSFLPLPPLDGSRIFFQSRMTFMFMFGLLIGYVILILFNIYSFIWAFIIGVTIWLSYYLLFERKAWQAI